MTQDQHFLTKIFLGDSSAFQEFYGECRDLFMAYFSKHYPDSKVSFTDLYQDAVLEFWTQVKDCKITQDSLHCSLSTYVIAIGINKMREGYRGILRRNKLYDTLKKHPDSYRVSGGTHTPIPEIDDREETENEEKRLRLVFLRKKYQDLGYPCTLLLRYTWYDNLTDNDILAKFDGYFANTNSLKTKRFKCRQTLNNMYLAFKKTQE